VGDSWFDISSAGVGDGERQVLPPPKKKNWQKYFSGKYHVKFEHVKFSYIIFGQKVLPLTRTADRPTRSLLSDIPKIGFDAFYALISMTL